MVFKLHHAGILMLDDEVETWFFFLLSWIEIVSRSTRKLNTAQFNNFWFQLVFFCCFSIAATTSHHCRRCLLCTHQRILIEKMISFLCAVSWFVSFCLRKYHSSRTEEASGKTWNCSICHFSLSSDRVSQKCYTKVFREEINRNPSGQVELNISHT